MLLLLLLLPAMRVRCHGSHVNKYCNTAVASRLPNTLSLQSCLDSRAGKEHSPLPHSSGELMFGSVPCELHNVVLVN